MIHKSKTQFCPYLARENVAGSRLHENRCMSVSMFQTSDRPTTFAFLIRCTISESPKLFRSLFSMSLCTFALNAISNNGNEDVLRGIPEIIQAHTTTPPTNNNERPWNARKRANIAGWNLIFAYGSTIEASVENSGGRFETGVFVCAWVCPALLALKRKKGNTKILWKVLNKVIPQVAGSRSCF